jgi:hypothetical protein
MNKQEADRINLICEEYLSYLLKLKSTNEVIGLSVRFNGNDNTKELIFKDNFPAENHVESANFDEISVRLIKGFSKNYDYQFCEGKNVIRLKLK